MIEQARSAAMADSSKQETFFELLSKVIRLCQEIHNDSRTPLDDALKLTPLIRQLADCKRELRKKAFMADAVHKEYEAAAGLLKKLNETVKAEVIAHQKTMGFIMRTTETAAAVLKLATAAAKIV